MPPLCVTEAEVDEAMIYLKCSRSTRRWRAGQQCPPVRAAARRRGASCRGGSGIGRGTLSRSSDVRCFPHGYYWRELLHARG